MTESWGVVSVNKPLLHDTRMHIPMLFPTKKSAAEMVKQLIYHGDYIKGAWKVCKVKIEVLPEN